MKGQFDWNKPSITPLGTETMIYIATDAWNIFAPHYDAFFVTGMTPHH
jgi:hypothetical protein